MTNRAEKEGRSEGQSICCLLLLSLSFSLPLVQRKQCYFVLFVFVLFLCGDTNIDRQWTNKKINDQIPEIKERMNIACGRDCLMFDA